MHLLGGVLWVDTYIIHMCARTRTHTHTNTRTRTHTHTHAHTYIMIYIYIYIHRYIYLAHMSTVLCAIAIKHAYVWLHATTVKDVKRSSSPRTFLLKKVRYSSPFISKVGSNLGFFVFFSSLSLSFSLFAYIHICIVTIDHILPLYALLFFNGIMMPGSAL